MDEQGPHVERDEPTEHGDDDRGPEEEEEGGG
jgi:hypothetical protein